MTDTLVVEQAHARTSRVLRLYRPTRYRGASCRLCRSWPSGGLLYRTASFGSSSQRSSRTRRWGSSAALQLSFSNFAKVLNWQSTFLPLINSAILSGGTAAITVAVSLFAAYPLSRYQMRFRKAFLYIIVFSTGLPITAILVPVYAMFARFNLVDSVPAVILFMAATSLPFGIWLMKGFMDGVPLDLEQAAWVDGASWLKSLRWIVAPLMLPGIAVITIFTFVFQWGNFLCPVHPPAKREQVACIGQHLSVLQRSTGGSTMAN